ncbi:hypothetical protein [Paraherbaspirillum soli]|uniref:Pilus assembly protein n=1 Tax=Paraherbaspirillum soli TaxID=631222 RepID=A0ABW0MAN1_9BURK
MKMDKKTDRSAHLIPWHVIVAATSLLTLAGCVSLTPNLDSQFGNSVNLLKAEQTIAPNASANTAAVRMDGQAAREVVDRYYKSYKAPTPQPNVFAIGVGGSSNGGGP